MSCGSFTITKPMRKNVFKQSICQRIEKPYEDMTLEEKIDYLTKIVDDTSQYSLSVPKSMVIRPCVGPQNPDQILQHCKGSLRLLKLMKKRQAKKK